MAASAKEHRFSGCGRVTEAHEAYRTGHNFATRRSIFFHLVTLSGPSLLVVMDEYIVFAWFVLRDSLSTMSTRDPEVVKGMRASMGSLLPAV